ncbi:uncharacterized protein LOC142321567 isoform X1 [Lycorma delicatula]|uniref:uncharacterized protein LOC142321567 isoform X1 n=1 Tax=Lycorma delicatula TaxID=130591 RepID=UPI003F51073A
MQNDRRPADSEKAGVEQPPPSKTLENTAWYPYNNGNGPFGTSFGVKPNTSFPSEDPKKLDVRPHNLVLRGGVQVLPPVVPPRTVSVSEGSPQARPPPPRPKPKPPVPPKRDELTRLTTVNSNSVVRKDPVSNPLSHTTICSAPQPRAYNRLSSDECAQEPTKNCEEPSKNSEEASEDCEERTENCAPPTKISDCIAKSAEEVTKVSEEEYLQKNTLDIELHGDKAEIIPEEKKIEDVYKDLNPLPIKPEFAGNGYETPPIPDPESSSSEEGATADIWVRAIDSPIKKAPSQKIVENNNSRHSSTSEETESLEVSKDQESVKSVSHRPPQQPVGTESLPCSRPSSRTTSRSSSPASFAQPKTKISAAEALGVVAKPCPRPSKRQGQTEFRRQSLGNLSDSKLSIGYDRTCGISCSVRGLWDSLGSSSDSSYQEVTSYRRSRPRGSSVDSRTLARVRQSTDCGYSSSETYEEETHVTGYSTLSRIGRYKGDKYLNRHSIQRSSGHSSLDASLCSAIKEDPLKKQLNGRPKSTCNCGHHIASVPRVDTGKRTFSVEELTTAFSRQCSEFTRASSTTSSARSSFGKSPRVTFALAEDSMGASGGAVSKHPGIEEPTTSRKMLRSKHQQEEAASSNRQQYLVQTGTPQSNRSQPAIGLKQTPKSRPTIFGTVASDLTPKEGGNCRRSLPQTQLTAGGGSNTDGLGPDVPEPSPDQDNALVYRDGNLVSGCLDALVQHMVPTVDYYPDRAYLFAFLLSSRLFIKPHELLGQVTTLCDSQQRFNDKHASAKERLGRFIPRLVQLLAEWSETFPYDFRDERVMAHVRNITHRCVIVEAGVRQEVSALLQNLLHRLTALEKYEQFLQRVNAESTTNNIESLSSTDVTELCGNASGLAQQLTHVELERLSYIGPEEFVQAFAKENPHLETSFKDMKKTRNLESYVSWFNRLSYFVATEVVKHVKKKQRVKVTEFWIEAARECFNIGNFNSLMAIIAGLNMSPISRLKKTWSKVQSAKFSVLEHQMDPSSNFSSYRSTLKAAMWRSAGATDERQRIVIPFFSLLVKDLYFLNEGCSNKLPNGHINFEKFWQLAKQVTEFITWKQVACPFEKNTKVITFLQASPVLTENALALASFECEPPENNHEKERYKALKAEMNL